MDFVIRCEELASILLQYLEGKDLLHFKLACSHFKQLVEEVVPLHHIIFIFRFILNNDQHIPSLMLPSNFILNPSCFDLFFKQIKQQSQKDHLIPHLITKFILHFHQHPLCKQFLQLPHNTVFLFQLANENYAPESVTFEQLRTINRLLGIINESKKTFTEDEHDYFVVDNTWVEEKQWSAAFLTPQNIYCKVFSMKISIPNNKKLIDCIIENKQLLLFLLTHGQHKNTVVLLNSLFCHSKWTELKTDTQIKSIVCELFRNVVRQDKCEEDLVKKCFFELKDNKEIVLAVVKLHGEALEHVNDEMKKDRRIVTAAVKSDGWALRHANDELQRDREIVLAAVKSSGYALEFVSHELKNDREIVLAAVKSDGKALAYASDELKNDREIVLAAVKSSRYALEYASDELKRDKEVVLAVEASKLQKTDPVIHLNNRFNYIEKIEVKSTLYISSLCFRQELTRIKQILSENGDYFQYLTKDLQQNEELLQIAVQNNPMIIEVLPKELQEKQIVMQVARQFYGI